jgi:hypothetical protein
MADNIKLDRATLVIVQEMLLGKALYNAKMQNEYLKAGILEQATYYEGKSTSLEEFAATINEHTGVI